MKKIFFVFIASVVVLSTGPDLSRASQIRILAPAEESFIGMNRILVIGQLPDGVNAGSVDVTDNSKAIGATPVREGTFVFRTGLGEGLHELDFSIPSGETRIVKVFIGKQEGYRYHVAAEEGSCAECHPGASRSQYRIGPMQEDICSKCHKPMGTSEYVHGPVAAGSCTPCHDPHGSRHKNFLVATGKELCLTCHDQNLSKKHIEERRNAQCIKCHDPHGSSRNYHLR